MKIKHIWLFITSMLFVGNVMMSQDSLSIEKVRDYKVFSLRLGADLFKPIKTSFEDNFQKTSLVYHMNTGLLLSAEIAIGGFILSFDIKSLDPSFTTSSSSSTLNFNSIIYFTSINNY